MNEVKIKLFLEFSKTFQNFPICAVFEPPQIREPGDHAPTHARTRTHAFDGKWVT